MSERTYSVYLVERGSEQGGQRAVTSPIEGYELEFYDTGVWLNRERGRNFFPYEQVRTIREHAGGQPGSEKGTSADEERDSADDERERPGDVAEDRPEDAPENSPEDAPGGADDDAPEGGPDDTPEEVGDQGAEEDLLE